MVFFIVTKKFVLYRQGKDEEMIEFKRDTIHTGNDLNECEWSGLDQKGKIIHLKEGGYITICTSINDVIKSFLIKD